MRRIAAAAFRPSMVNLAQLAVRWGAVLAGACLIAACAAPSPPASGEKPAADSPPLRTLVPPPKTQAATGAGTKAEAASPQAPAAGSRARREADLPPISTVVPSIAPAGVPGPNGMYSLDSDKPGEGLRKPPEDDDVEPDQQGMASWYGARFHKRRTASGERFDMYALTAAHPTLPFGTRVCVRSLATGRSVQVRINDRGPHTGGRIIDLSQAAAKQLGMLGLGTKPVAITALAPEDDAGCPEKDVGE